MVGFFVVVDIVEVGLVKVGVVVGGFVDVVVGGLVTVELFAVLKRGKKILSVLCYMIEYFKES